MIIDGREFNSFNVACNYYGVDSSYLYKKSKSTGKCREHLLREKINDGIRKISFTYNDKSYNSLSHFCRLNELDPVKVQSLVDNRGLSREDAITTSLKFKGNVPRNRRGHTVKVKGEEFASKSAACRSYNVTPSTIRKLVDKGYSFEEAILLKTLKNK